jgi:hypothetical protein
LGPVILGSIALWRAESLASELSII